MTQQGALLGITNFSIELGIPSDGFDEVGKVFSAAKHQMDGSRFKELGPVVELEFSERAKGTEAKLEEPRGKLQLGPTMATPQWWQIS